ncbi:hypothetical protein [Winogradskyella endarachnes]|uniref:Uncharacterized protein n=1 Tax=Winogradskyella endarachnes TaxID=2681965 RepID=A0A6L6UAS1_9FLAO|nr:hypothetical protein [Winogradskyella endarachnes]MUU78002.1 hypothetical protein [Winogradskyella endarachnes]
MKLFKYLNYLLGCVLLLNMQCNEENEIITDTCGEEIQIDNSVYLEAESHLIEAIQINDDCIILTVSDSGCDSDNWVITLVDSGNIAESMPPQRYLKLALVNDDVCLAYFTKQQTFDLTNLKIEGVDEVLLNFEGFAESVSYYY